MVLHPLFFGTGGQKKGAKSARDCSSISGTFSGIRTSNCEAPASAWTCIAPSWSCSSADLVNKRSCGMGNKKIPVLKNRYFNASVNAFKGFF